MFYTVLYCCDFNWAARKVSIWLFQICFSFVNITSPCLFLSTPTPHSSGFHVSTLTIPPLHICLMYIVLFLSRNAPWAHIGPFLIYWLSLILQIKPTETKDSKVGSNWKSKHAVFVFLSLHYLTWEIFPQFRTFICDFVISVVLAAEKNFNVYMDHIFLTYSSVDGLLGGLHFLAID